MSIGQPRTSGPIVVADAAGIERAAAAIVRGALVGMPTETVYGLGANALDVRAVAGIFAAKDRPRFDPLIVHVASQNQAWSLTSLQEVDRRARALAEAFWPGPLTMVLPKAGHVPDLVTSGLPSVALRVPGHPLARRLIERSGCPIAAPSANRFGRISPTTPEHVEAELGDAVEVILDGGPCETGVESTVVGFGGDGGHEGGVLFRPGGLSVERIEAVIGKLDRPGKAGGAEADPNEHANASPGMLSRHYAPRTPLTLLEHSDETSVDPAIQQLEIDPIRCGLLVLDESQVGDADWGQVGVLSMAGDLTEAAANLFAALRRLDEAGLERIVGCSVPERGLGRAINDRLRRAAADE